MRKLIDPIHFFDSHGRSMLTRQHEEERIRELEVENARLKQLLGKVASALKSERAKSRNSPTPN